MRYLSGEEPRPGDTVTEHSHRIGVVAYVIRYNGCEELAIDWEDGTVDNSYTHSGDLTLNHRAGVLLGQK
jgi:hypothetical protein